MNSIASNPPLTLSGRQRLQDELDRLLEEQQEATERLKQELQHRDDFNWYVTKERLGKIQGRILELQTALMSDAVDSQLFDNGVIGIGSRVRVQDERGHEHSFLIVAPIEMDPANGCISSNSPVGAALIGHRLDESISVLVPQGERQFTILGVSVIGELDGHA